MTSEQVKLIKERATELLQQISPQADPIAIRATVDLYVRVLDQAYTDVMPPRELTLQEIIDHDATAGLPGWERVDD